MRLVRSGSWLDGERRGGQSRSRRVGELWKHVYGIAGIDFFVFRASSSR